MSFFYSYLSHYMQSVFTSRNDTLKQKVVYWQLHFEGKISCDSYLSLIVFLCCTDACCLNVVMQKKFKYY